MDTSVSCSDGEDVDWKHFISDFVLFKCLASARFAVTPCVTFSFEKEGSLLRTGRAHTTRNVEQPAFFSEPYSFSKENVTHGITANLALTTGRAHTTRTVEQPVLFRATLLLNRDVAHGVTANLAIDISTM